ncbi:hypothetical protein F511_17548 [Dorcoceras hygrometricum]|uniref:Uncharacterized protein n=1 Tax=Dorcoceras hygrometricum TaxID=472368 RepID=A0A2Z7CW72_9LAMI|nr:hypothetical protein F511_17548 [Dorcoceras hygrometricum]
MVKRLATSPHDPLGITDSACKNQSVVVSVLYGPFNPYIPIRSTTIGKSRVARDPIAMHTSWRSNSDIASAQKLKISKSIKTGPDIAYRPKTSRAARDRPEPNPRRIQTSRHDIAGAAAAANEKTSHGGATKRAQHHRIARPARNQRTTCAAPSTITSASKCHERREIAALASQRPVSSDTCARQASHHRSTFAQSASPLVPASVWPTGAASCEKRRPALAQYRASFAQRRSSVGWLLRIHRARTLALKRTRRGAAMRGGAIAVDYRQSGPRPDPRLLRQAALEALTRSARTNTPRKTRPEQFPAKIVGGGGDVFERRGGGG